MPETMLDIFRGDAFSVISLTDALNRPIFQPGRIGTMALFQEIGISTIDVALEERGGVLALVQPTPRGGPGISIPKPLGRVRVVRAPHFQIDDGVMAEEVQGRIAWGSDIQNLQMQTVMDKVTERMMIHRASHEVTIEYNRMGAVKGVVVYADGSTLDLFEFFGITQAPVIYFDLPNPATVVAPPGPVITGALRALVQGIIRAMAKALGGLPFTGVYCLCGDNFFDYLVAHPEIRQTYINTPMALQLRQPYIANGGQTWGSFDFGGVTFENYRGYIGDTDFIGPNDAHFFPTGVPGLFKTFLAPADYIETVNMVGQRLYAKQFPMPNDKGVNFETQGNWLNVCLRPQALFKGSALAGP